MRVADAGEDLPLALGDWQGHPAAPFADDVVAQLGVDDYIHRQYQRAGGAPVAVYAGYYDSQRQGDAIHSPQNCLPGAGWQPVESGRLAIGRDSGAPIVNRYVIARGADRQVVLYWYQGRNRVVANEYAHGFKEGVAVAKKVRAPEMLIVPVPAP